MRRLITSLLSIVPLLALGCGAPLDDDADAAITDDNHPDPNGARIALRERVVFGGSEDQTYSFGEPEPFSHMARRWHAFPFTVYQGARIGAKLHTADKDMAKEATLRLYGPARSDGSWGAPRAVVSDANGNALLPVKDIIAGRYVIVVGPKSEAGFLERYPSDIGIGRWQGESTAVPQYFYREGAEWVTYREEDGARYRILSPLPGNHASSDPKPGDTFELDGPNGVAKWKLDEWSRSTWFVRDDGSERIGDVGNLRMKEGILDIDRVVNGQALPEEDDRYVVLTATGIGSEALVNPELLEVLPETIDGRRLTVKPDTKCPDNSVCNDAYWADNGKPVDLQIASAQARGFKPTFYDPGESSGYTLEVSCEEGCAPRSAADLASTRYPVYYAHGFNSSKLTWSHLLDTHVDAVQGMDGWFGAENVGAFSPVATRAEELRRNLLALIIHTEQNEGVPAGERYLRINVVAHSMGGLDTRYLIGAPRYNAQCAVSECHDADGALESCCPPADLDGKPTTWAQRIASLTTLSTPHCGSSFADLGVNALKNKLVHKGFEIVARKFFGMDEAGREQMEKTLFALSQQFCHEVMGPSFPAPNQKRVYDLDCLERGECSLPAGVEGPTKVSGRYRLPAPKKAVPTVFSWSGVTCISGSCGDVVDPALLPSYLYVKSQEGANDGVVSVDSAHFGIYMGVLPHDHFDWTRTQEDATVEKLGGRLAGWIFGVRKEPADRFHLSWLDRLRDAGY